MTTRATQHRTLTPAQARALGYTPQYETAHHVLCPAWHDGLVIFAPGGIQADETYLHKLDLDRHTPDQDPDELLAYIRQRIGDALYARLAIRRSKRDGYHIPFKTHRPLNDGKLYDPRDPGRHVGELCTSRIELTGPWLQGGPDTVPVLTAIELDKLLGAIHAPGAVSLNASRAGTTPGMTYRKQRIVEGYTLIHGYQGVTNWQEYFGRALAWSDRNQTPLRAIYEARHTTPNRSVWTSRFLQSLMLHAWSFGTGIQDRCRVVAQIGIHVGAAGKEREKDYRHEQDLAAQIAKCLHGDPMDNGGRWIIPAWAKVHPTPPKGKAVVQVAPLPPKPTHRPIGDKEKGRARLSRVLARRAFDTNPLSDV